MEKHSTGIPRRGENYRTSSRTSEGEKNTRPDNNKKDAFGHITPKGKTNPDRAAPRFGNQRNPPIRINLADSAAIRLANESAMPPLPLLPPPQTQPDFTIPPSDEEKSQSDNDLQDGKNSSLLHVEALEDSTTIQNPASTVVGIDDEKVASVESAKTTPASLPRGSVLPTREEPANPPPLVARPRVNGPDRRKNFRELKNQHLTVMGAQAHRAAKIQILRTYLPDGIAVDENGFLSGCHNKQISSIPGQSRILQHLMLEFNNQPMGSVYHQGHKIIAPDAEHVFANGNVSINLSDAPFYSNYFNSGEERLEHTSQALFELVGYRSRSLSRLFTSAVPIKLLECLTSKAGALSKNFIFIRNSQDRTYLLPGNLELADAISNIKGTDDAEFSIYKDQDGDFNVTCAWTAYCLPGDIRNIAHVDKDEIVRVDIEATFKVAEPRNGSTELVFSMPEGIKAAFAGRLQLN